MAKGIGVKTDRDVRAQISLAVLLAIEGLAHKALRGWNIAIRLDGPAANHFPSAFVHTLLNLREHGRIGALHPAIMCRRRMAVTEIRRLNHPVQRAAKSVERLVRAVAPGPQPRRVNVGVANDVDDFPASIGTIDNASGECGQGRNCTQRCCGLP